MGKRNIVGHCYRPSGNNDKIYILGIRDEGANKFLVLAKWGRRGKNLNVSVKGTYSSLTSAEAALTSLWQSQLKGGYLDIESMEYQNHMANTGVSPLTLHDPQIGKHLEDDGSPIEMECKDCKSRFDPSDLNADGICMECEEARRVAKKAAKKAKQEDEVLVCVDNSGMEDRFDIGIEYLVEDHSANDMVYVYDKLGRKDEYFRTRFVTPDQWALKQKFYQPRPGDTIRVFKAAAMPVR